MIPEFRGGSESARDKLNRIVDSVNQLNNPSGSQFVGSAKRASGTSHQLFFESLRPHLGKKQIAIAIVQNPPSRINLYRGEGVVEDRLATNLEQYNTVTGATNWELHGKTLLTPGQRLLAVKVHTVWQCYPVFDKQAFPAQITGGGPETYEADFYENGKGNPATGSGYIEVLSMALSETLPVGVWVIAVRNVVSMTGGEEE